MIIISHRGNLEGPRSCQENSKEAIDEALNLNFDCEVDLWVDSSGELFIGHDNAEYPIDWNWLLERKENLWIHCKNLVALERLSIKGENLNFFWHQSDDHVITSKSVIWSYPGKPLSARAIAVLPELHEPPDLAVLKEAYGICTDYPLKFDRAINGSSLL